MDQQGEDTALVNEITRIVRKVDADFQRVGGSSRHWVRDCFLPGLNAEGYAVVKMPPRCPCACGSEPWHIPGVCREGENVIVRGPDAPEDR